MSGFTRAELEGRHLAELHELASANRIPRFRTLSRPQLVEAILEAAPDEAGATWGDPSRLTDDEIEWGPAGREPEQPPAEEKPAQPPEEEEPEQPLEEEEPEQPLVEEEFHERPEPEESEQPAEVRMGVLDLVPDGYGFLRVEGLGRSDDDVYVSRSLVKSFGLRSGDELSGPVRPSGRSDRYPSLLEVHEVNGDPAEELRGHGRPEFEKLTPIAPGERIPIGFRPDSLATRMVDLLAAVGKGQRCLIASPPGAGATTLLREIARALSSATGPEPMIVLVDVRPEEITDWRRAIDAPVYGASSDSSPETHVRLAELALERARRLTEQGKDVVLLLDSLTRLARARSLVQGRSRRAARPDDDETAAENPAVRSAKRWFSAARNTEEQGSLTIAAIARVDSDSEFEQLVYEVLADSANMELRLDHELSRAGLFPALDVNRCWSHLESEVVGADEADWLAALRRSLISRTPADAWHAVAEKLLSTSSNSELIGAKPQ